MPRSTRSDTTQAPTSAAQRRKQELAADLRADLNQLQEDFGAFSDSAPLIREDRDARE